MRFSNSILKWPLFQLPKQLRRYLWLTVVMAPAALASSATTSEHNAALTFLWIAVILIAAKVSGLVEKWGQPAVLGELVIGVILGNLTLLGLNLFEPIKTDPAITFLAELGVVILLFQIGLESNLREMKKVGLNAFLVAVLGVIVPFVLGTYIVGPWIMPDLTNNAYLFIGAALTATSVGITARVFQDLKKLQTPEAKIVLGAAVIDDVLGLIILAIVSAIVTVGGVGLGVIGWITAKAVLFLVLAIILGQLFAPYFGKIMAKIHSGSGTKITMALSFGFTFAYLAQYIGLAPIVGAFAAGLVLDAVHFRHFKDANLVNDIRQITHTAPVATKEAVAVTLDKHAHRHVEDLIEPIGFLLIPIFFVVTGMSVDLSTLFDLNVLLIALIISAVAVVGKLVAGLVAGQANKWIVGFGMVPRGEVGLIFAMIGKSLGVINDEIFSIIVIMVILTTLATPPILSALLKKNSATA
ncbi:MAG: cation:proton antiporter [Candidatus Komeilibacteria bacterium]|nr:cation:proton antiporter [Candidatus Komeilibacteria bacterium]